MKFQELRIGDKFISEPLPEDVGNKPYYLFIKIGDSKAIRLIDGAESSIPLEMPVIQINFKHFFRCFIV